jgi:hypothetical protein
MGVDGFLVILHERGYRFEHPVQLCETLDEAVKVGAGYQEAGQIPPFWDTWLTRPGGQWRPAQRQQSQAGVFAWIVQYKDGLAVETYEIRREKDGPTAVLLRRGAG